MEHKIFLFFITLIYVFKIFNSELILDKTKKNSQIFCEVDKIKSNVKVYNATKAHQINSSKRKLDTDNNGYGPIDIYYSTFLTNFYMVSSIKQKVYNILNDVIKDIKKIIYVKHLNYSIRIDKSELDKVVNTSEMDFLNSLYPDSEINKGVDCDLLILINIDYSSTTNKNLMINNILRDSETNRIISSFINIPQILFQNSGNKPDIYFKSLFFHQFTHILGFLNDSFQFFPGGISNTIKTQADSRGILRTYIITPKVVELAKKYYNCDYIIGLELEDQEDGHPNSHWEARILLGEYMNSMQYNPESVLSEFTLALLEDSGWYKVNYFTGGLMRFGKHKGCNFLNNDCCNVQGTTLFKNEFFDLSDYDKPSCSSGRISRTYNKYTEYNNFTNEYYRRITSNNKIGGITINADYCFGFTQIETEENSNLLVGNCKVGNGDYGSQITYKNGQNITNNVNEEELGEKYSNNSFCVLSEAYPLGITPEKYDSIIHPLCYEMFCSNHSLTIKIKEQYVVCPRKGGKVEINGDFQGYIYCPDYNLICTGTTMCNDMFDCIEKESLPRNLTYDYEIINDKTSSQKISQIRNEDLEFGYEINDEGICPKNCGQCKDIKRCFKCLDGYILLGNKDNDSLPIICDLNTNVSKGYFIKDNVYYPCIDKCVECNNSFTCIKCDNIYKTNDDSTECIDKVENCETYTDTDYTCSKCKDGYAFLENDKEHCIVINDKTKYYTPDNGISYFPCDTVIANCDICNNNKDICSKCKTDYYLIDDNKTFCFNNKNLSKYYTIDGGISYLFCNNSIPFCDTCNNNISCDTCTNNYYFFKDNRTHCFTGFNLNKYYTEDNGLSYYPCSEVISNCDECNIRDNCQKCISNFYFIGNDRTICRNDFDKKKYYTENNISYFPCNTNFEYCDECSNKDTCTKCVENYGFIGTNRNKCLYVGNNEYYVDDDGISFYPCNNNLLNCQQCLNKTYCLKCNQSYYFIANDRTRCFDIYNLNEYYTEDNGISFYPCNTGIPFCKNCISKSNCTMCEATYYFIGNDRNYCINDRNLMEYYTLDQGISYFPCHDSMENCKNCIIPTSCMECQENTFFLRNDTSKCLTLNLQGYYTEDGKSYYPCFESMEHCSECYSKNACSKCISDYYLKFEIPNKCFHLSTFQNDKTYYKLNDTHYKKCSSSMDNCLYCNIDSECIQCEENYYFLNDNNKECININNIMPKDEYYKLDDTNYYSCGYTKAIENCKKCINNTFCLLCKDKYAFVSDIFNKCYPITDMKIGYYHNDDATIYYPCIENCNYCLNGIECIECSLNNELLFEKTICENCQINILNITDELNLVMIHNLLEQYFDEVQNRVNFVLHYINQNNNFSITIFRSWECTNYLFAKGYFSIDTLNLTRKVIEKNGETLFSLTYIIVNYDNNKNYFEIYNSKRNLINLKQICPECPDIGFIIKNNLTNYLNNLLGKEITNNIKINDINIFNETDSCFSNFCNNFTIENIDIPLKERREILFLGNQANEIICLESTCEIENITITELSGSCKCKIKSDLPRLLGEITNEKITLDDKGKNNFPIFTCYKEGFNKNNIKSNIGFYIGLILIIIEILLFIFYIISTKSPKTQKMPANPPNPNENSDMLFIENFDEIMKENGMSIINDNENQELNYQDRDDLSEHLSSQDDEEFENKKTLDFLLSTEGYLTQRGKKNNHKLIDKKLDFDAYSVNFFSEKNKRNEKLLLKNEDENSIKYSRNRKRSTFSKNSIIKSKSSFDSTDNFNIKQIKKKNNINKVYPSINDAKKNNKTSFCEFYLLILGLRQPIINLFVSNKCSCLGDDYVPLAIKLIRFIFIISLNIFMNTLHLNHKYFYQKFEYFDNKYNLRNIDLEKNISSKEIFIYAFKKSALMGFVSSIFCYLVQELLNKFVINNRIEMDKLLNTKGGKVTNDEIKEILYKPKKKYIIVVSISFLFMIGFYFCIINFYGVYRGGIIDYLAASTWTFIFIQIFAFVICLIFALLRYCGIKKSKPALYKLGQLLIY